MIEISIIRRAIIVNSIIVVDSYPFYLITRYFAHKKSGKIIIMIIWRIICG